MDLNHRALVTLPIVVTSSCCPVAFSSIFVIFLGCTILGYHLHDFSSRRIQSVHVLSIQVDEANFWDDMWLPGHDVKSFELHMLSSGKVPLHQLVDKLSYLFFCLLGKVLDEVRVGELLRVRT